MKSYAVGLITGVAITAAALMGYAYADEENRSPATRVPGECDVQVGFGRYTSGDECRFNQVMVGRRDDYLLCADVTVTCEP